MYYWLKATSELQEKKGQLNSINIIIIIIITFLLYHNYVTQY